ncbi:hypothetical protein [Vagococcus fessus]|uniref:Uncharacterized protein n=1 Tax=Vagococcus fessus TaxID=120370 RepID=A0A430A588_9ENTE|nr:hypothetical protein [Vagococcus fessus]RSU01934.1 hypothetical protein CBF31_09195 [Vagococcus fessus]
MYKYRRLAALLVVLLIGMALYKLSPTFSKVLYGFLSVLWLGGWIENCWERTEVKEAQNCEEVRYYE